MGAIKAGHNGYLLKEISIEEVANAIRSVAQGQSLISPSMASKLERVRPWSSGPTRSSRSRGSPSGRWRS